MPELPEVETMVRDLLPRITGRVITSVEASFPGIVRWPLYEAFERRVRDQRISSVQRRGKYAILSLESGDALIIHRGMSGSLLLRPREAPMERYVRLLFHLDNGEQLRLDDARKFGRVYVMEAGGNERALPWARMGPEPLHESFIVATLVQSLQGRTASIKALLLNQQIVAGLGNIYVDEALHHARLHPSRRANTLARREVKRLHAAIVEVLSAAVAGRGTTFNSYLDVDGHRGQFQVALRVFHRTGAPCLICGTSIIKLVVAGRGTHICPRCQKAPPCP
ncbi:MAG: bifunctional DNA-formamidopyrimidine glycosylase/DNA-(apurinic or apyrimidinic site) lyase [Chloroflexota bacterium]|nr:MAG: formamidopyrimidine-DNA glycosylase [Chloroflexota bacterium]